MAHISFRECPMYVMFSDFCENRFKSCSIIPVSALSFQIQASYLVFHEKSVLFLPLFKKAPKKRGCQERLDRMSYRVDAL